MGAYHQTMAQWAVAEPAENIELVDEADDVTATDAHYLLIARLRTALSYAFAESAVVLTDIFLRVDNREQVSPDVLVAPAAAQRTYTVYPVPEEPVPAVTIEVLSPVNHQREGRGLAEKKRRLFGRIGVPLHIEIDPDAGSIALWELRGNTLVNTNVCTTYTSPALGGVTIEIPEPGTVNVNDPHGELVLDGGQQLARYYQEIARQAAHSARLEARLRELGIDPNE